ncbi:MAG: phosphoribosylformylglycinamidine synthase [Bacillota bacterium]
MKKNVMRIYVEKKKAYAVEAKALLCELRDNLGIGSLENVRIVNRYDVSGITEQEYEMARNTVFSEPPVDIAYDEVFDLQSCDRFFAVEYLPGQYDQRADSAAQCIQILTQKERPLVRTAKLILLDGKLKDSEFERIKSYFINPLEAREAKLEKPFTLENEYTVPHSVEILHGFNSLNEEELKAFIDEMGMAMNFEDLKFCQSYFKEIEKREPSLTEIKVIDTYWSDHCRHTTFLTRINDVRIEPGRFSDPIKKSYEMYKEARKYVYDTDDRDISLMDIAVIAMKELRKRGELDDLEVSDEVNACSIVVNARIDGKLQEWLVMFKNETHNHPTEIEPFGGAATCLGGAIRDPLSGRSYVFGAMRVTGSADPRTSIEDTLPGKLPQRKITTGAAAGYSSYGNQIGLATGQVSEVYDSDFVAKRMEIGAVLGAAPRKNIIREVPSPGDLIVLLGGRTGRDGCGGATGSSKEHTEESLFSCGAEVQKGNPPTERKIQRLFRIPEVSRMIKRCNDFGAGGVSVAIGELAPGLLIDLDKIPKKYEGLDGTELAISESQERMAVVISPQNLEDFLKYSHQENLEATVVAEVTAEKRLRMIWREGLIVDLDRDFLDTNGVKQNTWVKVKAPIETESYFNTIPDIIKNKYHDLKAAWLSNLQDLNICSQKGLAERFDSTIGAGTVLMPFGGSCQETPAEGLVMKLPAADGESDTAVAMTYGYNPVIGKWSPFHGAFYAVLEAVTKLAALGGDYGSIRLTLQEYFEKLGKDPEKWGKPFSALLGAYYAQKLFGIPAIGGKDSMSGTFKDINVPPTLVAFAVNTLEASKAISQEFKKPGSKVVLLQARRNAAELPEMNKLKTNFDRIKALNEQNKVFSAHTVRYGGVAAALSKMCFGNQIGFAFEEYMSQKELFTPEYGSIILEVDGNTDLEVDFDGCEYRLLGHTQQKAVIFINGFTIELKQAMEAWKTPLENVFPTKPADEAAEKSALEYSEPYVGRNIVKPLVRLAKPRVFIPVFPGTNCEGDTARAFKRAGGEVLELVFKNLTPKDIENSIEEMIKLINESQIIAIPGGFSGGDEPEGSAKFITAIFRNPGVKEAVTRLLNQRDGLMLGICNGFQALVKLGLLPYGEIRETDAGSPTLTYNTLGRHVSCMVKTRVSSTLSPWFSKTNPGDIHIIAMSHGEGRFICDEEQAKELYSKGQIAAQYVDADGIPTMDMPYNPNGSVLAVEALTSPDGRILGKMGHSERIGAYVAKNIPGEKNQKLFEAGIEYFG